MAEITRAGAVEVMAIGSAEVQLGKGCWDRMPEAERNIWRAQQNFGSLPAILAYLEANGWTPPMPREATVAMLQDGHNAARNVVRGGACGMTIEAQVRHEAARENAACTAMCNAAPNPLKETKDGA